MSRPRLDSVFGPFLGGCSRIADSVGGDWVGLELRRPMGAIPVDTGVASIGGIIIVIVAFRRIVRVVGANLACAGRRLHGINHGVPSPARRQGAVVTRHSEGYRRLEDSKLGTERLSLCDER